MYRKLGDPKLLTTTHQAMLLSLLYKSLQKDTQLDRVKMFMKRLLQVALNVQPPFACGILYLLSQLLSKRPRLQALSLLELVGDLDRFEDGEDKYYDIKEEKTEEDMPPPEDESEEKPNLDEINFKGSSWVHCEQIDVKPPKKPLKYNPLVRNPLYGGGEYSSYTELTYLTNHFHPTVALWAGHILQGKRIEYTGDPLKDFTLIRFLDRYGSPNRKTKRFLL